jgi:hypothetical protein
MRIYTSLYTHPESKTKMLNIIHVHLNDMGEEVTLETVYMRKTNEETKSEKPNLVSLGGGQVRLDSHGDN